MRILGGLLKGILENTLANKEKDKRWQKVERHGSQRTGTKTVTQSLLLPGQLRKLKIQEHASVFTSLHWQKTGPEKTLLVLLRQKASQITCNACPKVIKKMWAAILRN